MALRGVGITVQYTAWDTATNAGKTGDAANHTLRVIKDGTGAAASNSPAEVDSTNAPGVYKLTLTAAEMGADTVTLAGKSSTANVVLIPVHLVTEGGRLDVGISTRLAASGYTAPDNTGIGRIETHVLAVSGLVDDLETRLSAARAALLDNLSHLNVPVSSRLAASGYTTPPTVAELSDGVWDELRAGHSLPGSFGEGVAAVAGSVSGNVLGSVAQIGTDGLTAAALAASAVAKIQVGLATSGQTVLLQADLDDVQARLPAALVGGRIEAYLGSVAAGAITSGSLHTLAYERMADAVWDENVSTEHQAAGSAGHIVGQRLDVPVGTRLASGTYLAPDNAGITRIESQVLAVSGLVDELESRLTPLRATLIENLTFLDVPVSSRLAASGYTAPDLSALSRVETYVLSVSGLVDELEGRLSATRAALLDNLGRLDVPVSTRLAASGTVNTYLTSGEIALALDDRLSSTHGAGAWTDASTELTTGAIALAVDNRLTSSHGTGAWTSSALGGGSYQVRLRVTDGSEDLPNLLVTVRNVGGTLLARSDTDSSGSIYFQLDAGTYRVSIRTPSEFEAFAEQTLVVTGAGTETYTLTRRSPTVISPTGQRPLKPSDPSPWR